MSAPLVALARPEDQSSLWRLWQRVFGDSDEYLSLFFTHRFDAKQTLVARIDADRDPVAMLFLLPISFWSGNIRYEGRYIYAVATDPDFRSIGLSTLLLDEVHRRLAGAGLDFSALVPAEPSLFDYYGRRGFESEFYRESRTFSPAAPKSVAPILMPASLPDLLPLRDTLFGNAALYGRWDRNALDYQQRETVLLGGETLLFSSGGCDGYAVCHPEGDTVKVKEWGFPSLDEAVLASIAGRFHLPNVQLDLPATRGAKQSRPFAMTRWYHNERKREEGAAPVLSLVLD